MEKEIDDLKLSGALSVKELVRQLRNAGFQGQSIGIGAEIISEAKRNNAFTFLSFTSNMAASGLRGVFIDLARRKKIDAIITTSGSVDEDMIRSCLPYLQGSFEAEDEALGREGINRMGNVFVPNDRYEFLERKATEILQSIYSEKRSLSVSELLDEVGKRMNENSLLYWCSKNSIPVFCPGITDGAFGMQLAFFRQRHNDFVVDGVSDFTRLMGIGMGAEKTLAIILGGGIAKHHTIISNIINGLDYAVYVNSSSPYHGSLSGATTSEAKSWGKIKENSKSVTIYGDAAVVFPLLVCATDEFFR